MAQEPARRSVRPGPGFVRSRAIGSGSHERADGTGIGPSAAARLSVDHPFPRRHIATLGEALAWHGGLTLDYLHEQGAPQYIECNPRTVEPANAAASGVNIPDLQVRLTHWRAASPYRREWARQAFAPTARSRCCSARPHTRARGEQ